MSERPPILIAGDAAAPTGFARVIEGIFRPLHEKFEIHQLGVNYHGDPHELPWKVYPASHGGGPWGTHRLKALIEEVQPRLILAVNDLWIVNDYLKELAKIDSRPPVVLYSPIDSGPIERESLLPLDGVDRFATYTNFAKQVVEQAVEESKLDKLDFQFPEVEVIPHGVDGADFHVLEGENPRLTARRKLFPDREDLHEDAFIILNANRNQPRKRIDTTLEGFARFAANKPPDVMLFLHMGAQDQGWAVGRLARRLGIENRLLMSTDQPTIPHFPIKHLNHVFNACEVGLNTAQAEGWGLVSFEHAATGAAQIVPGNGPTRELWDGAALMLEPALRVIHPNLLTESWLIDPDHVAEQLERLYSERQLLAEMSAKAREHATRPELTWAAISRRWETLIDETLQAS